MANYRVNLVNVGSISIEVEADSKDEAIELAYNKAPGENIHTGFDMGEWVFASDLWPDTKQPDVEVID